MSLAVICITRYTYIARGQLATVIDPTGTTAAQYTYSANGLVLTFTDAAGNATRHVRD